MNREDRVSTALGIIPEGTVWRAGRDKIVYSNGKWTEKIWTHNEKPPNDSTVTNCGKNPLDEVCQEFQDAITSHYMYHLTLPWHVRFVRRLWYRSYSMDSVESHFMPPL